VLARILTAWAAALGVLIAIPGAAAPQNPTDPYTPDPNPCLGPLKRELLCPDLKMSAPYDLRIDKKTKKGRVLLRAANSINSRGQGPAELFGTRHGKHTMFATQKIYRSDGSKLTVNTPAKLGFKLVPGQGHYWKYQDAARFEIWTVDSLLRPVQLVRTGPKVYYCLRDLFRTKGDLKRSPRRFHYPACNKSSTKKHVTLGTSVGWSDIYPATYHEQWIDVTGLKGVYAFKHIADPENGIWESNEENNEGVTIVRLPSGRSVRSGSAGEPAPEYGRVDAR
jgi:hypothetical protein